jgi:hypothetical protein
MSNGNNEMEWWYGYGWYGAIVLTVLLVTPCVCVLSKRSKRSKYPTNNNNSNGMSHHNGNHGNGINGSPATTSRRRLHASPNDDRRPLEGPFMSLCRDLTQLT